MPRVCRSALVLLAVASWPLLPLRAEQPPAANEPTGKDVAKAAAKPGSSKEKAASDPVERIKEEALKRSQVMATLGHLTDVIGPRLTGSPGLKRANLWTRDRLAGWGLANAHLEAWGPFGRGWSLERFSAQAIAPQCIPLIAFPKAWSPGTDGPLVAEAVYLDAKAEADLAKYRGKLRGKIVLVGPTRPTPAQFEALASRLGDEDLLELADADAPGEAPRPVTGFDPRRAQRELARKRTIFLVEEGAAAFLEASREGDGGTLFVTAASVPSTRPVSEEPAFGEPGKRVSAWDRDAPRTLPQLVLAKEHFNRLARMIERGETLTLSVDLAVRFHDDDPMAYNTVAEIPGTDLMDELVMLGGHLDSWHAGTGATDNAAGVAVAMEAVRILEALGLKPRRTVRIALWTGEEQGLYGSKAYVAEHFGKVEERPESAPASASGRRGAGPPSKEVARKPGHEKLSVYFNLDNGTGKVRGVYLQGNESVRPIFRRWLAPFRAMGASTLSIADTGGTDHLAFDEVGIPGFEFIQDVIEYHTRTHHSNQDVFDRIQADDLKQASAVMAAFVYRAATADEKLPRKRREAR